MKVDLHVHSSERSPCGRVSEKEIARAALAAGINAIFFTDHSCFTPEKSLAELNKEFAPLKIFGGIEIHVEGEDYIVLGIHHKSLAYNEWTYPRLRSFCRQNNGFIALAHPFRYNYFIHDDILNDPPDAIELKSYNTPEKAANRIMNLAKRMGIPMLSNSDSHDTDSLGHYYNILKRPASTQEEIIQMLLNGEFTVS